VQIYIVFLDTYNGDLDDIGIWDRKLTPCEVSGLFLGAISGAFTTQPANKTVSVGNSVQFIASSNDLSASFQWQTDIGTGFQNLNNVTQYNGVTNDTLTISNTTLSNNNQPFSLYNYFGHMQRHFRCCYADSK
jgi:hypothetical protein